MCVYMVVANRIHYGSFELPPTLLIAGPYKAGHRARTRGGIMARAKVPI